MRDYVSGWLKLDEVFFLQELEAFRDYIQTSEQSIMAIQTKFKKSWDKAVAEDPDSVDDIHSYYEDEINKTYQTFPHIGYSSLYISLSALLESSIKKACNSIRHESLDLVWEDMAGNGDFNKAKAFLTKVGKIDLTPIDGHWGMVMAFWKLRNRIVHHGSKVELDDKGEIVKHQAELLKKYRTSLKVSNEEISFISTEILFAYISAVEKLIVSMYKLLQDRLALIKTGKKESDSTDLFEIK